MCVCVCGVCVCVCVCVCVWCVCVCVCVCVCIVLSRIAQRHGGLGVAKLNVLMGVVVLNVGVVI